MQFVKVAGATIIATTSLEAKVKVLEELGADHTIDYQTDTKWGDTVKDLTVGKEGVDNVIEVGGPNTLPQSLKAIKFEGLITTIGYLQGRGADLPSELELGMKRCVIRGIMVGSRQQFEQMNKGD
jgi:NADPH:quinone reductase-like Zn-dependent oxidoreductase